jgi:hypothetical protein
MAVSPFAQPRVYHGAENRHLNFYGLSDNLLRGERANDKAEHLYYHPGARRPVKKMGSRLDKRLRALELVSHQAQEVQSGT